MLFDFNLEIEKNPRSIFKNIQHQLPSYRIYSVIFILGIILAASDYLSLGIAFGIGSSVSYYLYNVWIEISTISFSTDGLNFDLQDVINDLEEGKSKYAKIARSA